MIIWLSITINLAPTYTNHGTYRCGTPHSGNSSVSEPLIWNVNVSEPHSGNSHQISNLACRPTVFSKKIPNNTSCSSSKFENSDLQRKIYLSKPKSVPIFELKHYKNLANTIEAKIEATEKNMFSNVVASSLSFKDKG